MGCAVMKPKKVVNEYKLDENFRRKQVTKNGAKKTKSFRKKPVLFKSTNTCQLEVIKELPLSLEYSHDSRKSITVIVPKHMEMN